MRRSPWFAFAGAKKVLRRNGFRRSMAAMARQTLLRLAVASTVVAGTVGAATPAWAPKYILGSLAYGDCVLPEPGSRFGGDFTVLSFSAGRGELWVTAAVSGACVDGLDVTATVPAGVYTFPVESIATDCDAEFAGVDIRPGAATVAGEVGGDRTTFTLDLYPSTIVERTWMTGEPKAARGRLCAVHRMAQRRSPAQLAKALNALVLRV